MLRDGKWRTRAERDARVAVLVKRVGAVHIQVKPVNRVGRAVIHREVHIRRLGDFQRNRKVGWDASFDRKDVCALSDCLVGLHQRQCRS